MFFISSKSKILLVIRVSNAINFADMLKNIADKKSIITVVRFCCRATGPDTIDGKFRLGDLNRPKKKRDCDLT